MQMVRNTIYNTTIIVFEHCLLCAGFPPPPFYRWDLFISKHSVPGNENQWVMKPMNLAHPLNATIAMLQSSPEGFMRATKATWVLQWPWWVSELPL